MLEMKMAPAAKAYLISGYPRSMRDVVEYSEKVIPQLHNLKQYLFIYLYCRTYRLTRIYYETYLDYFVFMGFYVFVQQIAVQPFELISCQMGGRLFVKAQFP